MHTMHHNRLSRARRGFTITEAAAVAAAVTVVAASTVPVFRRVGCNAMREQSAAQLASLAAAHAEYAADFNGRQFTACPDNLGAFGGDFAAYQQANGCVPPLVLGTSSTGTTWSYTVGSGSCPGSPENGQALVPFNFSASSANIGAYRLMNNRGFNTYVGGRFYDQTFYAPDDPAMKRKVQRWINEGRDFEFDGVNYLESTYDYSPAAMFHPRVFGDGTNPASPSYLSPNSVPNGEGYKSPSNAQCLHPSLKTRLLERHCMEPYLGMNPNLPGGQTPFQWNHSYRSRGLAAFFDGSVRLFTAGEAMSSERRSFAPSGGAAPLWLRGTPLGFNGFYGAQSDDFLVETSVHYLTTNGIRGRDTLPPQ